MEITNIRLTGQELPTQTEAPQSAVAETPQVEATAAAPEASAEPSVAPPSVNESTSASEPATPAAATVASTPVEPTAPPADATPKEASDWYKENGFEEEHKEYLDKLHAAFKEGKLKDFLEATTKDYDNIDDLNMLKLEVRAKHPNANAKQLEILEKKELQSRGIDLDDLEGESTAEALEILAYEMSIARDAHKAKQKEYNIPSYDAQKKQAEEAEKVRKDYEDYLEKNEELRMFERDKSVKFGDVKIDFPEGFSPKSYLQDPNKFWALFDDGKGGIDMQRLVKAVLIAQNPDSYFSDAVNAGKSSAEKAHFDEVRNPQIGSLAKAVVSPDDGKPKITNVRATGSY